MENAINKIVSQEALNQIESLIVALEKAEKQMDTTSAKALKVFQNMNTAPTSSDALTKQLNDAHNAITQLQKDTEAYKASIDSLNAKVKQLSETKKSNASTDRQTIIDNREIRKELDGQAIANSNLTSYIQKLSVERAKASRIVADYNAQIAMGTQLTEQQSAELAQATASFTKYDNAIKAGKKSIGDAREYVGQYERANLGLVNSVNQIVREVPSATFGIQTFFLAISNNVPIMVDEISRAVALNKKLKESGEESVSVWGQVGKAIFSFNTLLNVGLLLLALYGKEIGNWVTELINGKNALEELDKLQEKHNESIGNANVRYKQEIQSIKEQVAIIKDRNMSDEARLNAIEKLKSATLGHLNVLDLENQSYVLTAKKLREIAVALEAKNKLEANKENITSAEKRIELINQELEYRNKIGILKRQIDQSDIEISKEKQKTTLEEELKGNSNVQKTLKNNEKLKEQLKSIKEQRDLFSKTIKEDNISTKTNNELASEKILLTNKTIDINKENISLAKISADLTRKDTENIKLNTKAREDYLASEYELWKLRKTNESNANKDIMNDEKMAYDIRLMASEQYYSNEIELAQRAQQEELRVLEFTTEEKKASVQAEYDNRIAELDKYVKTEGANIKLANSERIKAKELLDYNLSGITQKGENDRLIINENYIQKYIDINKEAIGKMQRLWDEINFGKADIEISNIDLTNIDKVGQALKGIQKGLNTGEIAKELEKINKLSKELALDIKTREAELEVQREENNIKRIIDETLATAVIMGLSDKETDDLLANNLALINAEKKLIEAKKKRAQVSNDVANNEIDNDIKTAKKKEDLYEFTLQSASRLSNDLQGLSDRLFQNNIDDYDRQIQKSNDYYDKLLANAEKGSEQEKLLQQEKANREEQLQKKRIDMQRKQAMLNKLFALADIAINLQLEMAKNGATTGTIPASTLNAIAIASAVIRTATVLSTPLPQYKTGRGKGKDEFAVVGDGGVNEVIERGNGRFEVTPNTPTITHLGKDDIVHKSLDDFKNSKIAIQNASIMASFGNQNRQLQMFDYYLSRELNGISIKIEKGIEKGFKKAKINNYVNMPKIDIDHIQYKNKGLNS